MARHIFLEKAFIYSKRRESFEFVDYIYDDILGYWVQRNSKKPAVYNSGFPGLLTKKEDIETGEDLKGE